MLCLSQHMTYHKHSNMHTPARTVRPPRAIKVRETTSDAVLFTFNKSPTNGASYEATFTTKRKGISNLGPISIAASRRSILFIAPGLIPDVDYTLSIVAISGSERSTPATVDVTTSPASKVVRVC